MSEKIVPLEELVEQIEANVSQSAKDKLKFFLTTTKKLSELNLFKVQSIAEL